MALGNNIGLGLIIGGAVGASFAGALRSASSKIDAFKSNAEKARGFKSMIGDTIRLREELSKAAGTNAFAKIKEKHDKSVESLKRHGINVKDLKHEYDQLGKTIKGLEMASAGRARIGEGWEDIKKSGQAVAGVVGATVIPTMASANFESVIRDISIKGGIARTSKESALSEGILKDAKDSGMNHNELAQAVNTLVAGSMDVAKAASMAGIIARFSVGQNAQSKDVADMILALRKAGIDDPKLMKETLGKIAVAGDLGSFEAKDMGKHLAGLLPQMTGFGFSGDRGAVELANMLQTQMSVTTSTDEAANNLANLLSKITSEDSKAKFAKQGFDLTESMQVAVAKGLDPITAFLQLVQEAARQTDPDKAARMAELQKQVAEAQDPAAAQKMLDGYLEMAGLSEFISDRQAKQGALAMLQNQKLHESNLKLIQSADGEAKIEVDLAHRRAASAKKWEEASAAIDRGMIRIGDALRPITDWFAESISTIGSALENFAKESPNVVRGLTITAAAFAALGAVVGVGKALWGAVSILRGVITAAGGAKIPKGIGSINLPGSGSGGIKSVLSDIGGIGGSIAGAKIGAMTGLVAGPVGSAVLATIGGVLGGFGVDFLLKKFFPDSKDNGDAPNGNPFEVPAAIASKPSEGASASQQNTFSPTIQVTVNGDVKDPRQVATEIMPHLRTMFEQQQSRMANSVMFDPAHAM